MNAPVNPTPFQTPVNVYIHGDTLTNNTPSPGALNRHIKSVQSGTQTPVTSLHTSTPTPHTPTSTTHTPTPTPCGKRGEKIQKM